MSRRPSLEGFAGRVVWRGDPDYAAVRGAVLWNARQPARYPAAIARASSAADVTAAVHYARRAGLRLAVCSGGHSWCGAPLRDGGLLLDLSQLTGLRVDAAGRTASIEPAVTGRALATALAAHGLAFPVGHCGSVALGGYLLAGGFGWNSGAWGMACFNVLAVDVVLADGRQLRTSAERHADLFWAARGAGPGFFGVVTRFVVQLHALPAAITTSTLRFALADTPAVVDWVCRVAPQLPRSVELSLLFGARTRAAAAAPVCSVTATAFAASADEAAAALAPLHQCPLACIDRTPLAPTPFEALFDLSGDIYLQGKRFAVDTLWSASAPTIVLPRLGAAIARAPSAHSVALATLLASPPQPLADAAFSLTAPLYAACYAIWDEASGDAANQTWLNETMAALAPFSVGHYVGEADLGAAARAQGSFSPSHWQRLQALRRHYDPQGLFHDFP
jgi:FAD/FMN-containing dehydrogenase